jgi:hypothetical protein
MTPADARQAHFDMLNRYCSALDTRDWKLLTSLFTEDALFTARMMERGVAGPDDVKMKGRAEIIAQLMAIWENLSATHHMIGNQAVEIAPDLMTAKGSCYIRAYHAGTGKKSHLFEESLGRFDFETARMGAEWKIRRWDENIMVMLGTREVFGIDG